eukprot:9474294-Pyramimonas_sp.AAC.1
MDKRNKQPFPHMTLFPDGPSAFSADLMHHAYHDSPVDTSIGIDLEEYETAVDMLGHRKSHSSFGNKPQRT